MSVFGRLVSRASIVQAILTLLTEPPEPGAAPLLLYYLADVERQLGLTPKSLGMPPGPSSYRSEVDFETFQAEWLPLIGVDAQPTGRVERHEGGEYGQWYLVQACAIAADDDEDQARIYADAYAIALAAAVVQNGSLGGIADRTVLTTAPNVEYVNPDVRQVSRATVQLQTYVQPVLVEYAGKPVSWPADPYAVPEDWPEIETVTTTETMVEELPGETMSAPEPEPAFTHARALPKLS